MKEIKEFDNFKGQEGYLIVDGLDDQTKGGKIKVPNYSDVTDGYVLTKTTTDGTDDIVWSAPAGGGGLPDASKIIGQRTESGGDYALFVPYCDITRDGDGNVATVGEIKWLWGDVTSFTGGYNPIPQ